MSDTTLLEGSLHYCTDVHCTVMCTIICTTALCTGICTVISATTLCTGMCTVICTTALCTGMCTVICTTALFFRHLYSYFCSCSLNRHVYTMEITKVT